MNFTIGDTPEQLNTKLAHIDSALLVDGLVYTQETVRQLKAERDALAAQLVKIQDAALKPCGRTHQQWTNNIKRNAS